MFKGDPRAWSALASVVGYVLSGLGLGYGLGQWLERSFGSPSWVTAALCALGLTGAFILISWKLRPRP